MPGSKWTASNFLTVLVAVAFLAVLLWNVLGKLDLKSFVSPLGVREVQVSFSMEEGKLLRTDPSFLGKWFNLKFEKSKKLENPLKVKVLGRRLGKKFLIGEVLIHPGGRLEGISGKFEIRSFQEIKFSPVWAGGVTFGVDELEEKGGRG